MEPARPYRYADHLPDTDSRWLGEGYDHEKMHADDWLVEMSGIPFALFSEMLEYGGNIGRGMLCGMTARLGWFGPAARARHGLPA